VDSCGLAIAAFPSGRNAPHDIKEREKVLLGLAHVFFRKLATKLPNEVDA